MRNMRRWGLSFDLRNVRVLLFTQLGICVLLSVFILVPKEIITAKFLEPHFIDSNFFFFSDFILAIVMMFTILILFSEDFGKDSLEYINSLPISKFHFLLVRFLRMSLFVFVPHMVVLCFFNLYANGMMEKNVGFVELLKLSAPTALFLMSFSLFVMVLTRKLFYSTILVGGYLLLDASSMGNFLGDKTLFISMYVRNFSPKQIADNRTMFFMLSLLLIILACLLFRSKTYERLLNH
jgi:hypothetical protein